MTAAGRVPKVGGSVQFRAAEPLRRAIRADRASRFTCPRTPPAASRARPTTPAAGVLGGLDVPRRTTPSIRVKRPPPTSAICSAAPPPGRPGIALIPNRPFRPDQRWLEPWFDDFDTYAEHRSQFLAAVKSVSSVRGNWAAVRPSTLVETPYSQQDPTDAARRESDQRVHRWSRAKERATWVTPAPSRSSSWSPR
jgi:hypothetical protein